MKEKETKNIIKMRELLKDKKFNKVMFIIQKQPKEEEVYKKLFKTYIEEYISTEGSPVKKDSKAIINKTLSINEGSQDISKHRNYTKDNIEGKNKDINNRIKNEDICEKEQINKKKNLSSSKPLLRKKDEDDYNMINNIINKHKDFKKSMFKLKINKLRLPWKRIKNIKGPVKEIENDNNKKETFKRSPKVDYILIENNESLNEIFNSLKEEKKKKEFLRQKRKKSTNENKEIKFQEIKEFKQKEEKNSFENIKITNIEEEKTKEKDLNKKKDKKSQKLEKQIEKFEENIKLKEKEKEKEKEELNKKEMTNKKEDEEIVLKNLVKEILTDYFKKKEKGKEKENNENKNEKKQEIFKDYINIKEKENNGDNNEKKQEMPKEKIDNKIIGNNKEDKKEILLTKNKVNENEKNDINNLEKSKFEIIELDKNKNNDSLQTQIINLNSTDDVDSFTSQIIVYDEKEKYDNYNYSKDISIINLEEDYEKDIDILLDLINNKGIDEILNNLCKCNMDNENEVENKLNVLKNKYGDLKFIFMLLKAILIKRKGKNEIISRIDFNLVKEFQNNFNSFKNLLFSDLCSDLNNVIGSQNNLIPKFFRDKIHSIEKINGNFQKCVSCCDEGKKIDYFCKKCKIPIHPECFTNYHNNHVYNSVLYKNQISI